MESNQRERIIASPLIINNKTQPINVKLQER